MSHLVLTDLLGDTETCDRGRRRFRVHGVPVDLTCSVGAMTPHVERVMGPFAVPNLTLGSVPRGTIRPYVLDEVIPTLSESARPVASSAIGSLYRDGRRYWLVRRDVRHRRGPLRPELLAELGPGRGGRRPDAAHRESSALADGAASAAHGVHLIPAASVACGDAGILLLSRYSIERELSYLAASGGRIIGQRWTALRVEDGRVRLLHFPGMVQRSRQPRRYTASASAFHPFQWADLHEEHPASRQDEARCAGVLIVEASGRDSVTIRELPPEVAPGRLRRVWPLASLEAGSKATSIASVLGNTARWRRCSCPANPRISRSFWMPWKPHAPRPSPRAPCVWRCERPRRRTCFIRS